MAEPLSYRQEPGNEDPSGDLEPPDQAADSGAIAEYLGDMIGQLESMARVAGLDLLVYLLSMARVEAETSARASANRS